ncbi:MAG: hypothetical protein QNJ77_01030 [Acidimicrobiia bacterium]|nr:hypothetical protein [Acidimicrobiia bacterium]MDJ0923116.1 hypothetical protein [Acidimicrobiia bacterium]
MAERRYPTSARRIGYGVAAVANLIFLLIVNNLLDWGWFSWLTEDFETLLPIISLSLVASIFVNLAYILYDAKWFKALCEIGLVTISLWVAIRTWQVFPFDFSAYSINWESITRAILVFSIIGMSIALLANAVKLVLAVVRVAETQQAAADQSTPDPD